MALEHLRKWDKNLKWKVAEILTEEFMFSEELSSEDDSAIDIMKTLSWETSQLKKKIQ